MTISKDQFRSLHSQLASAGGFTVNPNTGAAITSGISVAPAANEGKFPVATSSPSDLERYHGENTERFGKGASFGGWRHEGTDYLDTPTVYPSTPGGTSRSRNHMLRSNQIASFNIGTSVESFNPYHAANRGGDIVAHDSPEERETWKEMPRRVGKVSRGPSVALRGQSFS